MGPHQDKNEKRLHDLAIMFWVGSLIAGGVIAAHWDAPGPRSENEMYISWSVVYILWSGLIWAGAHLAVKKGRELVEGAVLGAFGPLGFIIEVLLPASKAS